MNQKRQLLISSHGSPIKAFDRNLKFASLVSSVVRPIDCSLGRQGLCILVLQLLIISSSWRLLSEIRLPNENTSTTINRQKNKKLFTIFKYLAKLFKAQQKQQQMSTHISKAIVDNLMQDATDTSKLEKVTPICCGLRLQNKCEQVIRQSNSYNVLSVVKSRGFDESETQTTPRDNYAKFSISVTSPSHRQLNKPFFQQTHSTKTSNKAKLVPRTATHSKGNFLNAYKAQKNSIYKQKSVEIVQSYFKKLPSLPETSQEVPSATRESILRKYDKKRQEVLAALLSNSKRQWKLNQLREHLSKGKEYSYTFSNEGEILLAKRNDLGQINRPRAKTKIQITKQSIKRANDMTSKSAAITYKYAVDQPEQSQVSMSRINMKLSLKKNKSSSSKPLSMIMSAKSYLSTQQQNYELLERRRKIFNNNQNRQTSSAPFFKTVKGVQYSEQGANCLISCKTRGTDDLSSNLRQLYKSGFMSHATKRKMTLNDPKLFFTPKKPKSQLKIYSRVKDNIKQLKQQLPNQTAPIKKTDRISSNSKLVQTLLQHSSFQ